MEQQKQQPQEDYPVVAVQNVVVMRHGDRADYEDPQWALHAPRPWDPPLTDAGKMRAWTVGRKLRGIGFPIHRVVVSPFLRCVQTAAEAVAALCCEVADESLLASMPTSVDAAIDPSRVKVHVEFGLCEVINAHAMKISVPAKDENWFPDISEHEAILPAGTLDHSVEQIYQQLPRWEELMNAARNRYESVIVALANKFPGENLLLVTHGEAVKVSVSSFGKDLHPAVGYCGLSHLQRKIDADDSQTVTAAEFSVVKENSKSGVHYYY